MAIINNIRKNADSLKEGGAAALGTLILGGSKAEAAMAGVGQAILTKLIGPLGKVAGVTLMATRGIYNMTKAWATMGTGAAAKLETVQNQLRVMLKGLEAAKQRVRELRNFSIATPFKMPDIVAGNRALESLTRGALVTKEAMTQVGDAAAQAGVGFEDMAVYVGRLYDGLAGGRPVGEVLFRLAELGVISGQARTSLEKLQESGAGFSEQWRVVESELKRGAGTMDYTSKTLEGLQSTLEDTQDELKATFSENFMTGQKEAIEAQIKTLQNLKPAVQGVSDAFSRVVSAVNTVGSKLAAWVTSIPLVSGALEFLARAAALAMVSITALAAVTGATRLVGGLAALAASAGLGGTAMRVLGVSARFAATSLKIFAGPLMILVGLLSVVIGGISMYTDRLARLEKAQREYAGATDAMLDKMKAQREMIKTLDQLSASYASTLDALAQAYLDVANAKAEGDGDAQANAEKRVAGLKGELTQKDAINRGGLEKSQMYVDAQAAREANERNVQAAAREAARATMTPSERAQSLGDEADELAARRARSMTETNGTEAYRQKVDGVRTALRGNAAEQAAPQAAIKAYEDAKQERQQLGNPRTSSGMGAAIKLEQKIRDLAPAAALAQQALIDLKKAEADLLLQEMQMAEAQDSEIVKLQAKLALFGSLQSAIGAVSAAENKLKELRKEPEDESDEAKLQRLKDITAAELALQRQQEAKARLAGASQIAGMDPAKAQEMQARLAMLKQEAETDNVNRPEEIAKRAEQAALKRQIVSDRLEAQGGLREQLAGERGAAGMSGDEARAGEAIVTEKARLALLLQEKAIDREIYDLRMKVLESQERVLAHQKAQSRLEDAGNVREQIAAESGQLGSPMLNGYRVGGDYAKAKEGINSAKAQLALQLKGAEIDRTSYDLRMRVLESQERLLERERAQRNEEAAADLAVAQAGEDQGALAAAQEQIKQEQQQLDLAHQRGQIETSIYEMQKKKLGVAQQELDRRKAMAVAENAAEVKAGGLELGAKAMRLSGKGAQARALEEQAQREREEAGKAARVRELMDKTGMSKGDAEKQVGQEIGRARLGRKMDQEGGLLQALLGKGQVVDNMQRIGGGGGVSQGGDIKKVIERLDKLIQEVKNQGGTTTLRI